MADVENFPLVAVDDDGIRPAGAPDACFYCNSKVGSPHGRECVVVTKRVRLRYTFEVEVSVPHHWTAEDTLFHRTQSSWCSGNAIDELDEAYPRGVEGDAPCPCSSFACQFVAEVDTTPTVKRKTPTPQAN